MHLSLPICYNLIGLSKEKSMRKESILLLAVILIAVFPAQICFGAPPKYDITQIPLESANAINDIGQVVGYSYFCWSDHGHASLWDRNLGTIDLGALGDEFSKAYAINDCGQVVGFSGPDVGSAFIWDIVNGIRPLEGIGQDYASEALGINNVGQVVGNRWWQEAGHTFIWDAENGVIDLGTLGGTDSTGWGINNAGQVVGSLSVGDSYNPRHGFIWDSYTGMIDLGTLGGYYSEGFAINGAGQVVGYSEDALGNRQMFLWDSALGMVALGRGYPWAINDAGQVVGSRSRGGDAFYWDSETGMMGLDELIPSSSGWKKLEFGFDINNRGQIVGQGITINDEYHAFLMTPVLPTIKVPMKFTPRTINCYSKGKWVKAHLVLPAEFTIEDVNSNSLTTVHPLGIEPNYTNVFVNENGLIEIEAAFDRAYFCSILRDSLFSEETITVRGSFTSGQYFYGMDTIKLINNNFERLGLLSSQWLRADCSEPDWCEGADIDQDSEVNFNDFAFMAFHWLEDHQ